VADSHIALLEAVARHQQRRVDRFDDEPGRATGRRVELAIAAAARARTQVTAAKARRRVGRRSAGP
jgi:hypothetical protein